MITLTYYGNYDLELLRTQLLAHFPSWREELLPNNIREYFGLGYDGAELKLFVPDITPAAEVDLIISMHDPSASKQIDWPAIIAAKNDFLNLPNYATWTPEEASGAVHNMIFQGWNQLQIDAWIDTNVISLATARDALKTISTEIVDLREITKKVVYLLMILRTIVVKRSNLP